MSRIRRSLKTKEVEAALLRKFDQPKYLTLLDVGCATGYEIPRRADAVSIALWPSMQCRLTGYEIKVSRGDFTRELRNLEKAQATARFCDRWELVVAQGVCVASEVPAEWGLLEARPVGDSVRLFRLKRAPDLQPAPISRTFLASLMRSSFKAGRR